MKFNTLILSSFNPKNPSSDNKITNLLIRFLMHRLHCPARRIISPTAESPALWDSAVIHTLRQSPGKSARDSAVGIKKLYILPRRSLLLFGTPPEYTLYGRVLEKAPETLPWYEIQHILPRRSLLLFGTPP